MKKFLKYIFVTVIVTLLLAYTVNAADIDDPHGIRVVEPLENITIIVE